MKVSVDLKMDNDSCSQENQESTLHGHGHVQSSKPDIMQLQYLKEITNNFSDERVLGEGGFVVVYKGVLPNGEMVAVKKFRHSMWNFLEQFENEVALLMRLKHANIVRLIGYCYETQIVHMEHNGEFILTKMTHSLICLEYLPKGSLDRYISDESSGLDWCTRYKIIEGICNGLQYLHEQIKPIIHLDLKPTNILLDDSMTPKVTDFRLSRQLDQEKTTCTLNTNGTRGYMPPEYIHEGTITLMSDIFSLGVIILEIVTGHRDYPDISRTSPDEFIELTVQKWRNVLEKAPACTSLELYCQEVKRCIQIGLICVNPERTKRPTTTKIIKMLQGLESTTTIMQFQHLKEITNNFSDERVLGEGGFGVVYKGVLQNGEMVAVKKLRHSMPNFLKQFENEVDLLMRLKHANIVQLIGYCYETQNVRMEYNGKFIFAAMTQSLLCLEYLPNGSLDGYISDESSGLDWCTRYKIIEGICNGLQYLHEQIKPIIHLDLKPANILLNDKMAPKVTDFGLSRLLDQEKTMCTLNTNGTRGYMPPEYIHGGTITPMSDIFSLGVIILEIVTGHRHYPDVSRTSSDEFIELTVQKWRNVLEKAPACTSLELYCQEVKRCIQIGLICVNPERTKRPTTTKVIKMLQGLESTDCHTGNEVTSPEAQIRPIPRELLEVDPLELSFNLDPDNRTPCLVKLRNKTDGYVAFHFNILRARIKYCIEPTVGFVWPRSMFNVVVTMEERQEIAPDCPSIDEFLVQSIVVTVDRVISEHITEDTFNNVPCKAVHKVNLAVVYVPPAQPASLIRVGSEEAQASDPPRLKELLVTNARFDDLIKLFRHKLELERSVDRLRGAALKEEEEEAPEEEEAATTEAAVGAEAAPAGTK